MTAFPYVGMFRVFVEQAIVWKTSLDFSQSSSLAEYALSFLGPLSSSALGHWRGSHLLEPAAVPWTFHQVLPWEAWYPLETAHAMSMGRFLQSDSPPPQAWLVGLE